MINHSECIVCGEQISINHPRLMIRTNNEYYSVCMGCEGEEEKIEEFLNKEKDQD